MMKSLQAVGLSVTLACLAAASSVSAAARYDGSKPMLCAVTAVSECTADGKCERSAPQAGNNLPSFLRVDLNGRVLSDNDGSGRKTEIKTSSVVDGQLILQGGENAKGWTMVIAPETGRWGASVVEDDGLFAVFGRCTLP